MKIITRYGMIRLLLLFGVLGFLCLALYLRTTPTKKEWLRDQAIFLSHVEISDEMVADARPWQGEGETWRYYLQWDQGAIPVGADGAVYVVTHSFHDDSSKWNRIGDVAIAVDSEGRLYTCEGHICGSLRLTSKKEVKTLQDFLETYSYDDEENTWKPYAK